MTKRRTTKPRASKPKPKAAGVNPVTKTVKVSPAAIIINRFDTRCGACFGVMNKREAVSCPHCKCVFTHVTTECAPKWMQSTVQALRKDLEYIEFGGLV